MRLKDAAGNFFYHRSGRIVCLGRVFLAFALLGATWLQASNDAAGISFQMVLGAYLFWSLAVTAATWNHWWRDYWLGGLAHVIDVGVFFFLISFSGGFSSPFYPFAAFILLAASIRWSWRDTAFTTAAVLIAFAGAGTLAMTRSGSALDPHSFVIRCATLIVLSFLAISFGTAGSRGRPPSATHEIENGDEADRSPAENALILAATRLRATWAIFVWSQDEEPWLNVLRLEGREFTLERLSPEECGILFSNESSPAAFLFDVALKRGLAVKGGGRSGLHSFPEEVDSRFARRFRIKRGLAIRIAATDYEGDILVLGPAGLNADDLSTAEALSIEISAYLDRASRVAVSKETAVTRAKAALARDLHDSVIQTLAGATMRLDALAKLFKDGEDPLPDVEAMKDEFADEQVSVRAFIQNLRSGRGPAKSTNLASGLPYIADELRQKWNIHCEIEAGDVSGPLWLEHELHQIIREAASNAVRHGGASRITIRLIATGGKIELNVADNGKGFPQRRQSAATAGTPQSLQERADAIGGNLSLISTPKGCRVTLQISPEDAV